MHLSTPQKPYKINMPGAPIKKKPIFDIAIDKIKKKILF